MPTVAISQDNYFPAVQWSSGARFNKKTSSIDLLSHSCLLFHKYSQLLTKYKCQQSIQCNEISFNEMTILLITQVNCFKGLLTKK